MKRILLAVVAAFFTLGLGSTTYAHTHLETSNPANGEIVTEPLSVITLSFDGKIEQGSFLEITSSKGIIVEIADLQIGDGLLIGTSAHPLLNGEYNVDWSIISSDGHPIEGDFSFTMNAPITEDQANESDTAEEETLTEQISSTKNELDEESSLFFNSLLILFAFLVIVAGVIFIVKRKSRD